MGTGRGIALGLAKGLGNFLDQKKEREQSDKLFNVLSGEGNINDLKGMDLDADTIMKLAKEMNFRKNVISGENESEFAGKPYLYSMDTEGKRIYRGESPSQVAARESVERRNLLQKQQQQSRVEAPEAFSRAKNIIGALDKYKNSGMSIPELGKQHYSEIQSEYNPIAQEARRVLPASEGKTFQPMSSLMRGDIETVPKNKIASAKAEGDVPTVSPYQLERKGRVLNMINDITSQLGKNTTGWRYAATSWMPGSPARSIKADLTSLKANIGFSELTAMREASKTGGALGQISNKENELLSNALGALDLALTEEDVRKNLNDIKQSILRWRDAVEKYATPMEKNKIEEMLGSGIGVNNESIDNTPMVGQMFNGEKIVKSRRIN